MFFFTSLWISSTLTALLFLLNTLESQFFFELYGIICFGSRCLVFWKDWFSFVWKLLIFFKLCFLFLINDLLECRLKAARLVLIFLTINFVSIFIIATTVGIILFCTFFEKASNMFFLNFLSVCKHYSPFVIRFIWHL